MNIKNAIKFLAVPFLLLLFSIPVHAEGFDAAYYAAKYPDVVAVYGEAPEALYNHYVTFGKREHRFQNAAEEAFAVQQAEAAAAQLAASNQALPGYGTYIDVNIDTQTVTCFADGVAIYQCACVSGDVLRHRDTPRGTFQMTTHTPGKYLKGPTWYCWVDYWMEFGHTQCGLHDASWRTAFGGNIYQTNGSHGCVNLSHADAAAIFGMYGIGTTVVVH